VSWSWIRLPWLRSRRAGIRSPLADDRRDVDREQLAVAHLDAAVRMPACCAREWPRSHGRAGCGARQVDQDDVGAPAGGSARALCRVARCSA
jgi:hypothetical protein